MQFFTPGRTEIIGNHTDHQLGRVIASATEQGIRAEARKNGGICAELSSAGYGRICVDLRSLTPDPAEAGSPAALVRGVAAALHEQGFAVGGFSAEVESELPPGGGLSSSAAFSVLIGSIFSGLHNGGAIPPAKLARCAQAAEKRFFGKPCGLMDQLACALGGAVYIDFLTGEITPISCDFAAMGLCLCLTDTGGSHAGLTADYVQIPADMCAAAAELGAERLGQADEAAFYASDPPHDRVHDRARHFFAENSRVPLMRDALARGNREQCLALMNASGRSSEMLLRNIRAADGDDRLGRGLALSAELLNGRGAYRVHGGGFAGCVQALVPAEYFEDYRAAMDACFGTGSCRKIL